MHTYVAHLSALQHWQDAFANQVQLVTRVNGSQQRHFIDTTIKYSRQAIDHLGLTASNNQIFIYAKRERYLHQFGIYRDLIEATKLAGECNLILRPKALQSDKTFIGAFTTR